MNTNKKAVRLIAEICRIKGIRKVVFSPGSRSAPLVIAFSKISEIECIVIPDERVAGYFALGMAQQLCEVVAVVCTSGTAVLNLSPAVCEAFYQKIPLLILTADRPEGAVAKGDNQAVAQSTVMDEFTFSELDINGDAVTDSELKELLKDLSYCFDSLQKSYPVRLNIRMSEPLYDLEQNQKPFTAILPKEEDDISEIILNERTALLEQLHHASKVLILIGSHLPDKGFNKHISDLLKRKDTVVLAEKLSNCNTEGILFNYDSCLEIIPEESAKDFVPDVIITLGNSIISKRIRTFFRKHKPVHHCDAINSDKRDFFEMGRSIYFFITEDEILECLAESPDTGDGKFKLQWASLSLKANQLAENYFLNVPFSDLKVFETLIKSFPEKANIQYGNSTPVRYSNFFVHKTSLRVNANRGTSGIDGCVSAAAGAAYVNKKMTICVVGDISFFYDSNALWNNYLSPDFRIIIINNGGGNIFRMVDGATGVEGFEKFFETKHSLSAKYLASMYGLPYYFCDSLNGLNETLKTFYKRQKGKAAILEIKTNNEVSADVYLKYFEYLRQNRK